MPVSVRRAFEVERQELLQDRVVAEPRGPSVRGKDGLVEIHPLIVPQNFGGLGTT